MSEREAKQQRFKKAMKKYHELKREKAVKKNRSKETAKALLEKQERRRRIRIQLEQQEKEDANKVDTWMEDLLGMIYTGGYTAEELDKTRGNLAGEGWDYELSFLEQMDNFIKNGTSGWYAIRDWFNTDFLCVLCDMSLKNKKIIGDLERYYTLLHDLNPKFEKNLFDQLVKEAVETFNEKLPKWQVSHIGKGDTRVVTKRTSFMEEYFKHNSPSTPQRRSNAANQPSVRKKTESVQFIARGKQLDFGETSIDALKKAMTDRRRRIKKLRIESAVRDAERAARGNRNLSTAKRAVRDAKTAEQQRNKNLSKTIRAVGDTERANLSKTIRAVGDTERANLQQNNEEARKRIERLKKERARKALKRKDIRTKKNAQVQLRL